MHQVFCVLDDSSAPSPYVEGAPASCEVLCGSCKSCSVVSEHLSGATVSPAVSQATHETANRVVFMHQVFL